jgi:hypothetical protein
MDGKSEGKEEQKKRRSTYGISSTVARVDSTSSVLSKMFSKSV